LAIFGKARHGDVSAHGLSWVTLPMELSVSNRNIPQKWGQKSGDRRGSRDELLWQGAKANMVGHWDSNGFIVGNQCW
jgi:hypothetical protein